MANARIEVLHVSTDTVKRDWRLAKLWLLRELEGKAGPTNQPPATSPEQPAPSNQQPTAALASNRPPRVPW